MAGKHSDVLKRWREAPHMFVREAFGVTPDPWQDDVLKAFPKNQRLAMKACKGPGKALQKSQLIHTPSGTVPFGSLKVGDTIFAGDGSPTQVTAVYDRGVLPVYRVTFDDGSSTVACGEHLWKVRGRTERRHDTWSVLSTEQIIQRGVREKNGKWAGRHFEIPRQGPAQFSKRKQPLDPYLMGVWLGDGLVHTPSFAMKKTDAIFNEVLRRGYDVRLVRNDMAYVYNSVNGFSATGVNDCRSPERFIPDVYKYGSIQQRRDLVCGLMDTDGEIADDGHMGYSSTSKRLADDLVWMVRSLGGVAYIKAAVKKPFYRDGQGEKVFCKDSYRVTVNLPFNPFLVPWKQERWKDPARSPSTIRYITRKIDSIEPEGEADCMCITVGHPSKLFLANDFIVTHNTALLAWLAWNFLLTRPHPKIAATSVTKDNLADNLWTEMAKWQNASPLLQKAFKWTKTRIFAVDHPETWWMSARPWSKTADKNEQSNTLAGLHADYIMFLLDESGGIPESIMASAEAALSSCVEGHIVQAGNPTHLEGPLYSACTREKRLWHITEISADPEDPKRTSRVKVAWAKEQIEKYGRDNPWVLVNVFGQFPPSSINSLLGIDDVEAAVNRRLPLGTSNGEPKVIGVDVARFGDDQSVVFKRQGLIAHVPQVFRNLDGTDMAGRVITAWNEFGADACFIDDTGGFGSSVIDSLHRLGRHPIGVHFSSKPGTDRYVNKRAEMAFLCAEWVKRGGQIPDIKELKDALIQTTYTFQGDKLLIEPKEQVKVKLGYSPDLFDALILTFAFPVAAGAGSGYTMGKHSHVVDYNPLSREVALLSGVPQAGHSFEYNPLRR